MFWKKPLNLDQLSQNQPLQQISWILGSQENILELHVVRTIYSDELGPK